MTTTATTTTKELPTKWGKIIEYTLVSLDGVFGSPVEDGFMQFRDDAYLRDGLGLLAECHAMLMGRKFYEMSAPVWQARRDHPWAPRLNDMPKRVFSSTQSDVSEWDNSKVVHGEVVSRVVELKAEFAGDLIIWGHTRLAEKLMRAGLIDVLDVSIHPMLVGRGELLFREKLTVPLRLVATKAFSSIVKLTYEPQYDGV